MHNACTYIISHPPGAVKQFVGGVMRRVFAGRMEDEHRRINHRLGKVEETIGEINRLTLSVQSLAESVQRMCKEQERQSERLQTLEDRDGDNWRALMKRQEDILKRFQRV